MPTAHAVLVFMGILIVRRGGEWQVPANLGEREPADQLSPAIG